MYDAARTVLRSDHAIIADAVFADPEERATIADAASDSRFDGCWLEASPGILESRIAARTGDASDADTRILAIQRQYDLGQIEWRRVDASGTLSATVASVRAALELGMAGEAIDLM